MTLQTSSSTSMGNPFPVTPDYFDSKLDPIYADLKTVSDKAGLARYNVRDYGAVGDNTTDDAIAIRNAITAAEANNDGIVFFPPGQYVIASTIATTKAITLEGVQSQTTIIPSTGVSVGLNITTSQTADGTTDQAILVGIGIDGNSMIGGTGLKLGGNSLTGRVVLRNVQILRCAGTGGIGIDVGDVVQLDAYNCYFGRSYVNMTLGTGSDTAAPTITRFYSCSFREATTSGVSITRAFMPSFIDCLFEANTNEGVYASITTNNILAASFTNCWFEANWNSYSTLSTEHHVKLVTGVGATINPVFRDCYFTASSRAIYLDGCTNFTIDGGFMSSVSANVEVTGAGSSGQFLNWPQNNAGDFASNVSINATVNRGAIWSAPSEVITSTDAGNWNVQRQLIVKNPVAPSSGVSSGVTGEIAWDTGYVYVCTSTDSWSRATLSPF